MMFDAMTLTSRQQQELAWCERHWKTAYTSPDGRYKIFAMPLGDEPPLYNIFDTQTGKQYQNRLTLESAREDVDVAVQTGGFETTAWSDYWTKKTKGKPSWARQRYGPPRPLKPEEVETATDPLGMPIDPGIRRAVRKLNQCSFITTGSCEGHTSRGLPTPWIDIFTEDKSKATTIKRAASSFNSQQHLTGKFHVRTHPLDEDTRIYTMPTEGKTNDIELAKGRLIMNQFVDYLCSMT